MQQIMNAGRSSNTARLVARSQILSSRDPELRSLVPAGSVDILKSIPAVFGGGFGQLIRFIPFRKICGLIERIILPGIATHYLVRKAWLEHEVRDALASGIRRVVVVGAGFDTLSIRLSSEFPEVEFLELDHPDTQDEKTVSQPARANLRFLAVDLESESPLEIMREAGFASGPAVVIAEGLTMYLSETGVTNLLRDAAILAGGEGRVLFSYMEKRDDGSIDFHGQSPLVRRWLDSCGERFKWGVEPCRIRRVLGDCGLAPSVTAEAEDFRQSILAPRGLQGLRLAKGEWLCNAKPICS